MTPHGEHKLLMHRTYRRTYCPECVGEVAVVPASAPAKVKRARATVARQVDAMVAGFVVPDPHTAETREAWLLRAVEVMRPWFPADHPVPAIRVSVGFPSGKGSSKLIGQCWYTTADTLPALFVSPELTMPLFTLLHEMVHAATPQAGHKGAFVKVARALGFQKPWTSSGNQLAALTERVNALYAELGDFPHAKVNKADRSLRGSVQSTRMLLLTCSVCAYSVRTTRKWIDIGLPSCPDGDPLEEAV